MKLGFGILCLIAAALAQDIIITNPSELFSSAQKYQNYTNVMQSEIFELITELRLSLSATMKKTATSTLSDIETDITTVFDIVNPLRTLIFITNSYNSYCLVMMRNHLLGFMDFSGFRSGICLYPYDRAVNKLLNETLNQLVIYDEEISAFELSVIEAFAGKNVWIQFEAIENKFLDSFNKFKDMYYDLKNKIADFSSDLEEKITELSDVLNACYKESHDNLNGLLLAIDADVQLCIAHENWD
ncbi:unnamed protein product [Chironomus riparius]|uniref:Uncharacterized protein n=1 Tax=Chironomus riparius TaxID=315576 RepID=A0A9N9WR54_9DIPT|nr:unnamed protein product [Chironomus riparius]